MKTQFTAETVSGIFDSAVQRIVAQHRDKFEQLDVEERLTYLMAMLADQGFLARWEKIGDAYHIVEYSCPYISVGAKHAEVCTLDKELIVSVMGSDIQQHSCMLKGDDCCQFSLVMSNGR
jgi:DeoR family transcriptional regulator, suf operon transcriptional repressor